MQLGIVDLCRLNPRPLQRGAKHSRLLCRLRELEGAARGLATPEQGPQEAVAALERLARKEEVLELGDRLAVFAYQEHGQPLVLMSEGISSGSSA